MTRWRSSSWIVLLAGLLSTAPAAADDAARAAAQALFDEAMKELEAKDYAKACPALEEVVRLQPGKVGAMIELARCYESAGKVASAWARFRAAADAARVAHDARATSADAKVKELGPKVPKVTIAVAESNSAVAGLSIHRDEVELKAAEWGRAIPLDPGKHVAKAEAPTKREWSQSFDVAIGATVTIQVPALEDAPVAPVAAVSETPAANATPAPASNKRPVLALVPIGVGAAGLVLGGVMGGLTLAKASAFKANCNDVTQQCPSSQQAAANTANTFATVSDVGFIAGGVLVAAGAAWYFWPRHKAQDAVSMSVGPGSVDLRGTF